jgi:hypothetical protein
MNDLNSTINLEANYFITPACLAAVTFYSTLLSSSQVNSNCQNHFAIIDRINSAVATYKDKIANTNYSNKKNIPFFILLQTIGKISIPAELEDDIIKKIEPLWNDLIFNEGNDIFREDIDYPYRYYEQDYIRNLIKRKQLIVPDFLRELFYKFIILKAF